VRDDEGRSSLSPILASGEDEEGDRDAAFENLVKVMAETELGKPRTNWDLLRQNPIKPYISERFLRTLFSPWTPRPFTLVKCTHCKGTGFIDARAIDCPHCDGQGAA
jgi:hypothetical protein